MALTAAAAASESRGEPLTISLSSRVPETNQTPVAPMLAATLGSPSQASPTRQQDVGLFASSIIGHRTCISTPPRRPVTVHPRKRHSKGM